MLSWPGSLFELNVESMHCIKPLDGCPAAALLLPVRKVWSSSRAVQVPSSVVTHQTSARPASSLVTKAPVRIGLFDRTAASSLQVAGCPDLATCSTRGREPDR